MYADGYAVAAFLGRGSDDTLVALAEEHAAILTAMPARTPGTGDSMRPPGSRSTTWQP